MISNLYVKVVKAFMLALNKKVFTALSRAMASIFKHQSGFIGFP